MASAVQWLSAQPMKAYQPFNLIFGHSADVRLAYGHEELSWAAVPQGVSVLTNGPLNSQDFPKVRRIRERASRMELNGDAGLDALKEILSDAWHPSPDALNPMEDARWTPDMQARLHAVNVHTEMYGTRSGAIIAFSESRIEKYLYCERPIHPAGFMALNEATGRPGEHDVQERP